MCKRDSNGCNKIGGFLLNLNTVLLKQHIFSGIAKYLSMREILIRWLQFEHNMLRRYVFRGDILQFSLQNTSSYRRHVSINRSNIKCISTFYMDCMNIIFSSTFKRVGITLSWSDVLFTFYHEQLTTNRSLYCEHPRCRRQPDEKKNKQLTLHTCRSSLKLCTVQMSWRSTIKYDKTFIFVSFKVKFRR